MATKYEPADDLKMEGEAQLIYIQAPKGDQPKVPDAAARKKQQEAARVAAQDQAAALLKEAAAGGVPFCEECESRKRALAAQGE